MNFADRLVSKQRAKDSIVVLGIDPQLDTPTTPGIPDGYTLSQFCCEIIEACADSVVAVKPQLAFFEARGVDGMRDLRDVIKFARERGLITIADAKRGDIGTTSAAYAEAFLGDGDFGCDAVCVNPYLGSDAVMPFQMRAFQGRGLFVIVKTSNPSSGEFQDLRTAEGAVWEQVARRVHGWGSELVGDNNLTPVGAVIGATYPDYARRARVLMPNTLTLVPGYGAQGASAADAVMAARPDGLGVIVNASRSLMYAYRSQPGARPGDAARVAAENMRVELKHALEEHQFSAGAADNASTIRIRKKSGVSVSDFEVEKRVAHTGLAIERKRAKSGSIITWVAGTKMASLIRSSKETGHKIAAPRRKSR